MSEIQEHVAYLSQEIGPRPAGTEEEQRAALYVAEALQKEAQLPTEIEDFNCNPNHDVLRMTWCALSALFILLSFFLPVMIAPALIVTLAMAVLFALEALGKSPFSRMFRTGRAKTSWRNTSPSPLKPGNPPEAQDHLGGELRLRQDQARSFRPAAVRFARHSLG